MARLQESKGRYSITLPKEMVQQKQWAKGQHIFFVWNERGNIELTDTLKK